MSRLKEEAPQDVTEEEWRQILEAVGPKFHNLISVFREDNKPRLVGDLFEKDEALGHPESKINMILWRKKIPFRLSRIGPRPTGVWRPTRKVAIVRC